MQFATQSSIHKASRSPWTGTFRCASAAFPKLRLKPCGGDMLHQATQTASRELRSSVFVHAGQSGYGSNTTAQKREATLDLLRQELKALEDERDEAVRTAESCAKTCVRLTDMSKLLEDLALEKIKAGDEGAAKMVLQEKNSLREIIDKSNAKAQANFALAGRLASLIGDKHHELVDLLGRGSQGLGQGLTDTGSASRSASWPDMPSTSLYGNGGGYQLPWERSLAEAQQRVRQAEVEAQRMGKLAALSAEDSIAAARDRLVQRGASVGSRSESILQARERLRRTAEESIAEARERLRAQDSQILEYCRRIVARYRRGEYVSEDELEFAFDQLEKRLL
ncbi:hypothetical protein Vretimale_15154 [Volvox reticuliferus]|uniref:Uncharacterized protein n=1 Tax=Volvox reticuliferus TaxID=1737510 RepID=A0A8J4LUP5_9CHLO|nr:hypothetical protein Vretifemale_5316 [Volvox reticuliferus]GIM11636.1 hypothetical protein Vretimale_15154 [Volvox reticuliferus]